MKNVAGSILVRLFKILLEICKTIEKSFYVGVGVRAYA